MLNRRFTSRPIALCVLACSLAAGAASAQIPDCSTVMQESFACESTVYIVLGATEDEAQLFRVVGQDPFVLEPVGPVHPFGINNIGFRAADGLIYGYRRESQPAGPDEILRIDRDGMVCSLGFPAEIPTPVDFNAGDVTLDSNTLYLNLSGQGRLYRVSLPDLTADFVDINPSPPFPPGQEALLDWAVNPGDNLLYGGDRMQRVVRLDPVTGQRTPFTVAGLPLGGDFGGSWFDQNGRLFLYENGDPDSMPPIAGTIYEVNLATMQVVSTQTGTPSVRNDATACIPGLVGAAKAMVSASNTVPTTVTIEYVFENLGTVEVQELRAIDDLRPVFGVHGTDWVFLSTTSTPGDFGNPNFDGFSDVDLLNMAPMPSLAPSELATVTVEIEVLTLDAVDMNGQFCNQAFVEGLTPGGLRTVDLSTDGGDPDPNGDGVPSENEPACITLMQGTPEIEIRKVGALDLGGDGIANPGDVINYTFEVENIGDVTLFDIVVDDPMVSPIVCPSGNPIPSLDPDEVEICTGSYMITQADIDAGVKCNTATATGEDAGMNSVEDDDQHCEPIPEVPELELQKVGTLDLGNDGMVGVGDVIEYTLQVTNTGNVTLTNVAVNDPMVDPVTCPSGNPIPMLAPGESETCTGTYVLTQADIDAGEKCNVATATGMSPGGGAVTDDGEHCEQLRFGPPDIPALSPVGLLLLALGLAGLGALRIRRGGR